MLVWKEIFEFGFQFFRQIFKVASLAMRGKVPAKFSAVIQ